MTWFRLSLAPWRQRPLRTGITITGVAVAVAAFCSMTGFNRGYQRGIRVELDRLGAHVLLVPKGCPYDAASMALHGASWPCYLKQAYLDEVVSVRGVAAVAPVFMTAMQVPNSPQAVYLGVETNILGLKPGWRIDGSFPSARGEMLIGAELQTRHGWKPGQRVELPGLPGQFATICGILAPTHGAEDFFAYFRLSDAQQLFRHPNELTHMLIRLSDPSQLEQVVAELRGCDAGLAMNVVPLAHMFRTIQSIVSSTRLLLACIALVAFFVAATGVSNTVLMSVAERTREIGVMRAVGASQIDIFRLVCLETLQACVFGAIAGQVLAVLSRPAVEAWARSKLPFAPADTLVRWDWQIGLASVVLAVVFGTMAAFLPACRAAQMPPVDAIRSREICA